jgi:hypothetical protein
MSKYNKQQINTIKEKLILCKDDPMWANHSEISKYLLSAVIEIIEYLQEQNEERFNQLLNMDKLIIKAQEQKNYKTPLTNDEVVKIANNCKANIGYGIYTYLNEFSKEIEKAHGIE